MEGAQGIDVVITDDVDVDYIEEDDCLICLQPLAGEQIEGMEGIEGMDGMDGMDGMGVERYGEWVCGHHPLFHPGCIRRWLESSKVCPVCRGEVVVVAEQRRRRRHRRGGFFRRHRDDGTREAFIEGQRHCTHSILFTVSAFLTSVYGFYGDIYIAAFCLITWSFVILQECTHSCHYLWVSLIAFLSFHIWMCHWILQLCTGPKVPICDNFMTIIYGHVVVSIYGLMFMMSTLMRQM